MKILVVIPAYNCAKQIGRVIDQFDKSISELFHTVLVIDNQSKDNTVDQAIDAFKKNSQLNSMVSINEQNIGYGGTLKTSFKYGIENGFDFLLILHGDDQGKVIDMVPYIIDKSINNYDCTLGARFHPKSKLENYSWFRTFGNKVFNRIFGFFLNRKILDLGSGLNIYKLDSFKNKEFLCFTDDLTFDYCGMISHSYRSRKIRFTPITWSEDDQVSNVKILRQSINTLKMLASYLLNKNKFMKTDKSLNKECNYETNIVFNQKKFSSL